MEFKKNRRHRRSSIKFFGYRKGKKVCYLLAEEVWEVVDLETNRSLGTRLTLNGQFGALALAREHYANGDIPGEHPLDLQVQGRPLTGNPAAQ